jgi:hypothetical protein
VSIPPSCDNEHEQRRRTTKAYRISRPALRAAQNMVEEQHLSRTEALTALRWAPRTTRDRLRRLAKVKPPTDGTVGVSDPTWALVLDLVDRDL